MKIGIFVSIPEHIDRFDPVLRRIPGASFLLHAGRWPSRAIDSRNLTAQLLATTGWNAEQFPHADMDLILSTGQLSAVKCRPWLREGGRLALWRDELHPGFALRPLFGKSGLKPGGLNWKIQDDFDLLLAPGETWLSDVLGCETQATGDPRFDLCKQQAARSRGRHFLGIDRDESKPVLLIHFNDELQSANRLSHEIAQLRSDYRIILHASTPAFLRNGRAFPSSLRGPGIQSAAWGMPLAELVAAADLILAEPSQLLFSALHAGKPALAMASSGRVTLERRLSENHPYLDLLSQLAWAGDRKNLHADMQWLEKEGHEYAASMRVPLSTVVGPQDGCSADRMAKALLRCAHAAEGRVGLSSFS